MVCRSPPDAELSHARGRMRAEDMHDRMAHGWERGAVSRVGQGNGQSRIAERGKPIEEARLSVGQCRQKLRLRRIGGARCCHPIGGRTTRHVKEATWPTSSANPCVRLFLQVLTVLRFTRTLPLATTRV